MHESEYIRGVSLTSGIAAYLYNKLNSLEEAEPQNSGRFKKANCKGQDSSWEMGNGGKVGSLNEESR